MHMQIRIDLGNEAMSTAQDVGAALMELGEKLHDCDWIGTPALVKDINGNTVGRWDLMEDAA